MVRKVHWVSASKDKKTGEVVASYSPKSSCPDTCTLKDGGCYAWGLFYLNILGKKIENGKLKIRTLKEALDSRKGSSKIVRHRIAGDIVGDEEATYEDCKVVDREGLINIGYTHAWREDESQILRDYFRASCQSEEEVLEARAMGWATTLIVPESFSGKRMKLANGETGYLCPARTGVAGKPDITCNTCTLCKVSDKTVKKTVLFKAHGSAKTLKEIKGKV